MIHYLKSIRTVVPRLLAVLLLLGCPQIGSAAGAWSLISLPQKPGDVVTPTAVAVDAAGDLYVADDGIQKRDAQENWSVVAMAGTQVGQVGGASALAADGLGSLFVEDAGRIQKRDAQGHWSLIATEGQGPDQVESASPLAVDPAGNLYVADTDSSDNGYGRIQKRDVQGNWSVIAKYGTDLGQVSFHIALAVDTAGNLYLADGGVEDNGVPQGRIQKRDAQGQWSVIATGDTDADRIAVPTALAVDAAGDLYVASHRQYDSFLEMVGADQIHWRDAEGSWSVIATAGTALGQFYHPPLGQFSFPLASLAVDAAGNLYVADPGNSRVQEYMPGGGQ
jgi:hypothetical protein